MNEYIKNQIYTLKNNTINKLDSIQRYRIPALLDFIKLTPIREYSFEGDYYRIYDDYTKFFIINNLILGIKARGKETCYVDSFSNLVKDGYIMPFLLFIDNKAVKWSNMTIVNDYNYTFLIVKGTFTDLSTYKVVNLPNIVKYGENSAIDTTSNISLYFNDDGLLTETLPLGIRLEVHDKYVYSETITLSQTTNWFSIKSDSVITDYNFLIFKDGYLYTDGFNYIEDMGMNIFKYTNDADIIDHELVIKYFYDTRLNTTNNIINRFDLSIIREEIIDRINNGAINTYLDPIKSKFTFEFTKDTANENLQDAKDYIDSYDQLLYRDIYLKNSSTESFYTTGKKLKELSKNNFITMSRRDPKNNILRGVMIFKNQYLYDYHYTMTIDANRFTFYVADSIEDDDKFEFLYFKNISNPNFEITIENNNPITLDNYNIEDIEFYSNEIEHSEYNTESTCMVQYKLNYTYELVSENKYKIIFEDEFYYGKLLTMVSKNRYHYYGEVAEYNKMYVELSSDFRFDRDLEHYNLFINGQKIPNEFVNILDISSNQPYDTAVLFTNIPIYKDDKVDVFYLPEYVKKFALSTMESNGLIKTEGHLDFNIDKYIYTFFINGRKIHPDYIKILSKNNVIISKDIGSIKNIEIYQYFNPISELSTSNIDIFNNFVATLPSDKKDILFPTINHNGEEDITTEAVSDRQVNYEVANVFHRRPDLNIINPVENTFKYHVNDIFSEDIIDPTNVDKDGNYIINLGIAVLEDKAPIYYNDYGNPLLYNKEEG